jgi:hypothetical protein
VQKEKKRSLIVCFLALLLCSVAYFVFSTQTANKTERLAALKEKCYLQIALTEDEKSELCELLFELENLPKENCENIENILFQQNLDEFFKEYENCVAEIRTLLENRGFQTQFATTRNGKGHFISASQNEKEIVEIRIMHPSSGTKELQKRFPYFLIKYVSKSSYIDKYGEKSNKREDWHIPLHACDDIFQVLNHFLNKQI